MEDKQNRLCLIFDFENIEVCLREQYELSLTENGFKKIIEYFKSIGSLETKNIFIGAYWANFKSQKQYSIKSSIVPINVPINTKNAADGALIYYLYEINKKVLLCSVAKDSCTKDELVQLTQDYISIESILEIKSKNDFNSEYTVNNKILPEWEAVVTKIRQMSISHKFVGKSLLINAIISASSIHPPFRGYSNFDSCKKLLEICENNDLIVLSKEKDDTGKEVWAYKINTVNPIIQHLL